MQTLLLLTVEDILRIKDAWSVEVSQTLSRILLEIFFCKDFINIIAEVYIINSSCVIR